MDVSDLVGNFGLWHYLVFFHFIAVQIFKAFNNLNAAFLTPTNLDYWCSPPQETEWNSTFWKQIGIPKDGDTYSKCTRYQAKFEVSTGEFVVLTNVTEKCTAWYYDHSVYTSTFVEEWNMVCDNEWMSSLPQFSTMLGFLLGGFIHGHISDIWGRRCAFLLGIFILVISSVLLFFSQNFWIFIVARCLNSYGIYGVTYFCVLMEVMKPKLRYFYGVAGHYGFQVGAIILASLMLVVQRWVLIKTLTACALTILSILLIKIAWESPRWLLSKKRYEEGKNSIKKIASLNGLPSEDLEKKIPGLIEKYSQMTDQKGKTLLHLFVNNRDKYRTLVFCYYSFATAQLYYVSTMTSTSLGGIPHFDFMFTYAMDIIALTICLPIAKYIPRRWCMLLSFAGVSVICFVQSALQINSYTVQLSLALCCRAFITIANVIEDIYSLEFFPTPLRYVGDGLCNVMYRTGAAAEPYVRNALLINGKSVLMFYMGCLAVPGVICTFFMPETLNVLLPDQIQETKTTEKDSNDKTLA